MKMISLLNKDHGKKYWSINLVATITDLPLK